MVKTDFFKNAYNYVNYFIFQFDLFFPPFSLLTGTETTDMQNCNSSSSKLAVLKTATLTVSPLIPMKCFLTSACNLEMKPLHLIWKTKQQQQKAFRSQQHSYTNYPKNPQTNQQQEICFWTKQNKTKNEGNQHEQIVPMHSTQSIPVNKTKCIVKYK